MAGLPVTLPAWRRLVLARAGRDLALADAEALMRLVCRLEVAEAVGPASLMVADLHAPAGSLTDADRLARLATEAYRAVDDPVGQAACALIRGDWFLDRAAFRTFGESLEPLPEAASHEANPLAAMQMWPQAEAGYRAAGATRGIAAATLRQAGVAANAGQ